METLRHVDVERDVSLQAGTQDSFAIDDLFEPFALSSVNVQEASVSTTVSDRSLESLVNSYCACPPSQGDITNDTFLNSNLNLTDQESNWQNNLNKNFNGKNSLKSSHVIPVIINNRLPFAKPQRDTSRTLQNIHLSEDNALSSSLPNVASANVRSLWNKYDGAIQTMQDLDISVLMVNETWERENLQEKRIIETALHEHGINFIGRKRPGHKTGGGVGLLFKEDEFQIEQVSISTPTNFEFQVCYL